MSSVATRNARTGWAMALFALGMLGLAFAAVPLYRLFCQVTGFAGTTMRVDESALPGQPTGRIVRIRFDANTAPGLGWEFQPEERVARAAIGARKMAFYTARNLSDRPVTGTATFNVTPVQAGPYFSKIQCFCFNEQTLRPGEEVRMPVVYFVDPKIMDNEQLRNVDEITLSYTFFPVDRAGRAG